MLGASRRSLCAATRPPAPPPATPSPPPPPRAPAPPRSVANGEPGVAQLQKRLLSVLAAPKLTGADNVVSVKLREGALVGRWYESSAAAVDSSDMPPAEKFEYQAEVNRLMDLIVHSLYSNKEVFLRELVSNASDVLDKLCYLSVTDPGLLKDGPELDIRIQTDKDNGIITITDTGIGMTRQELVESLGTIASSGTAKFVKTLKESQEAGVDSNLIGNLVLVSILHFLFQIRSLCQQRAQNQTNNMFGKEKQNLVLTPLERRKTQRSSFPGELALLSTSSVTTRVLLTLRGSKNS